MSATVRIMVAEPSVIIRGGVLSVLRRHGGLHIEVYEVGDMEQLRGQVRAKAPGVLIVNPMNLGSLSLQQIKRESPDSEMKCIALQFSLYDSSVLKEYDEVISAYDSVEQINDKISSLLSKPREDKRHESLSAREKEVIVCVIQGMTNKQIAEKLFLSTHTIITHRRNISAKLQIHSTAGLTIYAIVNKLVELDDVKGLGGARE